MAYTSTDQEPRGKSTALNTMKEICDYLDKSANTVLKLAREEGLPLKKIGGQWTSDVECIDEWRRCRVGRGV